jgi:hypothetical protein
LGWQVAFLAQDDIKHDNLHELAKVCRDVVIKKTVIFKTYYSTSLHARKKLAKQVI